MPTPHSTVDLLAPKIRQTITDMLVSGASLDQISRVTGVSRSTINRYKKRTVLPALKLAGQTMNSEQLSKSERDGTKSERLTVLPASTREIVKQAVVASPLRERLDSLWNRIDKCIDDAESPDKAALINQAHKNLELLGRATGELVERSGTTGTGIQTLNVLMMPLVTQPQPESAIVDVTPVCDDSSS